MVKTKQKPFDFVLFITVLIMLAFGVIMVLSASSPSALSESGNSYAYVTTQAVSAILGIILMLIISKIDYKFYAKFYKIAYWFSIVILLAVLIPGVGKSSGGATRWINLMGVTTFQPSEIVKIALIVFYAVFLSKNKEKLGRFGAGFITPFLIVVPIIAILIFVQSHLSVCVVIILVISVMMLIAGTKLRYFLTCGVLGAAGGLGGLYLIE